MVTLAPDGSRVKDQIKRIQNYVWAVYIDGAQPQERIDEDEALRTLDVYYSRVGNRNSPDQVYVGILLFEKAFEDPETQAERFERARKIFEFYRRVTGETDWNAVEDRLEDIASFFEEESGEGQEPAPVADPDQSAAGTPAAPVAPATPAASGDGPVPAPVASVGEPTSTAEAAPAAAPETPAAEAPPTSEAVTPPVVAEAAPTAPAAPAAVPSTGPAVVKPVAKRVPTPSVKVVEDPGHREAEEAAARREALEAFTAGLEVVEGMCLVPAGTFLYGVDNREIFLDSFYIDETPVTNAEYQRFVREMGYRAPRYANDPRLNNPTQPIVGISFGDAQQYAKWAGKELPSELQWEKAARGTDGRPYPWGNDPPGASDACFGLDPCEGAPIPVNRTTYNTSAFGVRDMSGNVWEWTTTPFQKDLPFKVVRGGCYNDPVEYLRVDFRMEAHPKDKAEAIGFRCVKNIHA